MSQLHAVLACLVFARMQLHFYSSRDLVDVDFAVSREQRRDIVRDVPMMKGKRASGISVGK